MTRRFDLGGGVYDKLFIGLTEGTLMTRCILCRMLLVASLLFAAACSPRVERRLDEVCRAAFPEGEPGAAVLIMKGDNILYDKGFGLADLETKVPIDGNTSFNIASVSKQFTSVAVLQLVAEGKLRLGAKVRKHFPEYTDPIWDHITVAHLLSHSSGIPDGRGYLTREQKIAGDEDLAVEYMATLDTLHFFPGSAYEYINPTYVLLGRLVERVSGEPFTDYVHRHIFAPAGMDRTVYFDRDHQDRIPNMAHGYEYEDVTDMPEERTAGVAAGSAAAGNGAVLAGSSAVGDGAALAGSPAVGTGAAPAAGDGTGAGAGAGAGAEAGAPAWYEYDFGEETFFATRPDGGIYTSTHEFVKWERALRDTTVLPTSLLIEAMSPYTYVSDSPWSDYQNRPGTWYGLGWFIEPVPTRRAAEIFAQPGATSVDLLPATPRPPFCIYHTGDNGGFKILAARYPASQTLVLVFANRADWDRYALKTAIEDILGLDKK